MTAICLSPCALVMAVLLTSVSTAVGEEMASEPPDEVRAGDPPADTEGRSAQAHQRDRDVPSALGVEAARILARTIQIVTINPPGDEAELARYLVSEFQALGIESKVIPTPSILSHGSHDSRGAQTQEAASGAADAPPIAAVRAAAWARVAGRGEARPLILLSHLDTVPANPDEWHHGPFEGVIEDGFVHGRGALDAKGVAVIHLLTLAELARRETPLDRDVIFLATPDEESGGTRGAGYLAAARPDLLGEAEYLLTEGGGIRANGSSESSVWGIGVIEKTPCWLRLSTEGTPGHSSAPARDAAVPRLVAALERIRRIETPLYVVPEVARMFETLAPRVSEEDRAGYLDLRAALMGEPSFRSRFLANRGRNALVRDTVSITMLEGGPRVNVAPRQARAMLDVRLLPGASCEAFRESIVEVINDAGVQVEIELSFASLASSIDTELFRSIERVARRRAPSALVAPRMIGGFTDAHWFRARGLIAYGFVPRRLTADQANGVHGPNERASIDSLERGVRILLEILEDLSAPTPNR